MTNQENILTFLDQAIKLHQQNRLEEAEDLYNKILNFSPRQYDALNLLGVIAQQRGETDKAINLFNQAINVSPDIVTAHFNKGNTLRDKKHLKDAERAYNDALQCDPRSQDTLLNLGALLQEQQKTEEALKKFLKLIQIDPKNSKAHYNAGKSLHELNHLEDAEKAFQSTIKLDPNNADAYFALANLLDDLNKYDQAINYMKKAVKIRPDWALAYSNLGNFQKNIGNFTEALLAYNKSLVLDPNNYTTRTNQGLLQLCLGDFQKGWVNYNHKSKSLAPFYQKHNFKLPTWNGEDLSNENILLWNEQGLGDEILYASMVREFSSRTRSCTLLCSPKLTTIFHDSFCDIQNLRILENHKPEIQYTDYDRAISLSNLGQYLRQSEDKFPKPKAYLKFNSNEKESMRNKLEDNFGKNKKFVGISWSSSNPYIGNNKSIPINDWIPFLKLKNVQFINLQYGNSAKDIDMLPKRIQPSVVTLSSINLDGELNETLKILSALAELTMPPLLQLQPLEAL